MLPGPPEPAWDRLATDASSIFATRAWHEAWWRHFGTGTPRVLADDDRDPTAIIAVHESGRALRRVRLIGHGAADGLGAIAADAASSKAVELLRSFLRERRWDVFVAHDVPIDNGWTEAFDAHVLQRVPSPVIQIETNDWTAYLSGKSKNFREQLRRRERKLDAAFDVVYRLATDETLQPDLETLFDLHRLRWGDDALFATGVERRFHEDFARVALDRSWLRLWTMELDGAPVASLYGYRYAGADYFVQSGRDPKLDSWSVGSLLLFHTVRQAVEDGMSEYRLLRGGEQYKAQLADVDRPVHTIAVAGSALGRAAIAVRRRR